MKTVYTAVLASLIIALVFFSCSKDPELQPNYYKTRYHLINTPMDLTVDKFGNIYFTNSKNYNILKINPNGTINKIAGTDTVPGCTGDGMLATGAHLNFPCGIAIDRYGNIYIGENYCSQVQKINISTGIMNLVAGNGNIGGYGDGGQATNAALDFGGYIAIDTSGNLIIADVENNRVRKVDVVSGIITTIAGTGSLGSLWRRYTERV